MCRQRPRRPLILVGANATTRERTARHYPALERLARIDSLDFEKDAPKGSAQVIIGEATACIPLGSLIDVAAETARLTKAIGKVDADIERSQKKLGNEKFIANADPEVVATERERFEELKQQREQLTVALSRGGGGRVNASGVLGVEGGLRPLSFQPEILLHHMRTE